MQLSFWPWISLAVLNLFLSKWNFRGWLISSELCSMLIFYEFAQFSRDFILLHNSFSQSYIELLDEIFYWSLTGLLWILWPSFGERERPTSTGLNFKSREEKRASAQQERAISHPSKNCCSYDKNKGQRRISHYKSASTRISYELMEQKVDQVLTFFDKLSFRVELVPKIAHCTVLFPVLPFW